MFAIMTKDKICDKFTKKPENHFAFSGQPHECFDNNNNEDIPVPLKYHDMGVLGLFVITNDDFHAYFYCRKLFSLSNINCTICLMTQIPAYRCGIIRLAFAFNVMNC